VERRKGGFHGEGAQGARALEGRVVATDTPGATG
jgi:hypothetical protein